MKSNRLMNKNDKIYVAGSSGMVGNALCKLLIKKGYNRENKKHYVWVVYVTLD